MSPLPRPLPVLFLVPNLETGGAERQLTELVTRMDRARFTPVVVCQKGGGPFYDEIARAGIEVHRLEMHGRSDPRYPIRLAGICRNAHVRAMVIRGFSTGVIGRIVGRMLEEEGYSVRTARNGDEALAALGMGRVAPRERVADGCPGLPVIWISGYPRDAAFPGAAMPPDQAFLEKPVSAEVLLAAAREVIGRRGSRGSG